MGGDDVYGALLADALDGRRAHEVVERDDGGSRGGARRRLARLSSIASARGRIVAETFDPHALDDPVHRRYRDRNVRRGRMPGQLRVRVRHRDLSTSWFDWLQVSRQELEELLEGTAWRLSRTVGAGPSYVAIIDRD